MKKIFIVLVLALVLALAAGPVLAVAEPSPKEEIVYGILNPDGSVKDIYVVNIFNGGSITDYGNYSEVRNMTTSEKLIREGDKITINTAAGKFYYQGTLESKELPWDIEIKYYLDGKEISGEEIAGKTGKAEISLSVKKNTGMSGFFFDNYALQIALSLDNKLFSNIEAENATLAEAGGKKQLSYIVLPGSGMDISVKADVRDFAMDSITVNGILLSLGLSVDKSEFAAEIDELARAVEKLDGGAGELLQGIDMLARGMEKYIEGTKAFKDGLVRFAGGADLLNHGAKELERGLAELSGQSDSIVQGALAIQQATFDALNAELGKTGLPTLTPENYSTILASIPELEPVKSRLDGAVRFTRGIISYTEGVTQLGAGAAELARGTEEFKAMAAEIAGSAHELYQAGEEINAGIKKLRDGLVSYKKGTEEFKAGTANMGTELDERIDEIIGSLSGRSDGLVSFVSEKNTNVTAVQFVLKADAISAPKAEEPSPASPVQEGFWQKLVKLFTSLFK